VLFFSQCGLKTLPEARTQRGGVQNQPFDLSFNASLKIDFQGSRITSDGGLILVCKLDTYWALAFTPCTILPLQMPEPVVQRAFGQRHQERSDDSQIAHVQIRRSHKARVATEITGT
jgi:hypothetical protein